MAVITSITSALKTKNLESKEGARALLKAVGLIALIVILVLGWKHFFNKPGVLNHSPPMTKPSQLENNDKKTTSKALSQGDYHDYQVSQQNLAVKYLTNSDIKDAERIMVDVFNKVPSVKIISSSYMVMANIQKAKSDNIEYKKYLLLTAEKLRTEGDTSQATLYQNVADTIK